ncbi:hypothetical protein HDV62DRAFT_399454 [Trichoderma sp. SZMC 28011]
MSTMFQTYPTSVKLPTSILVLLLVLNLYTAKANDAYHPTPSQQSDVLSRHRDQLRWHESPLRGTTKQHLDNPEPKRIVRIRQLTITFWQLTP